MLKKVILLVSVVLIFTSYKWYKSYQIPFETSPCQNNWIKYSNNEVQFEFPHNLFVYKRDKIANLPSFYDSKNEVFYVFKGMATGFSPIDDILRDKTPISTPRAIIDSLRKIIPNQNEDFYLRFYKDRSLFEVIEVVTLDAQNFEYAHKIRVGVDTFLSPVKIYDVDLERLKMHTFLIDTIDNCYRKIYYNSITPSKYAACFLRDLSPKNNKHAIISLSEIGSLNTEKDLNKEDILRVLKSFRMAP